MVVCAKCTGHAGADDDDPVAGGGGKGGMVCKGQCEHQSSGYGGRHVSPRGYRPAGHRVSLRLTGLFIYW